MTEWRDVSLGDVLTLQRGFDLPARDRVDGPVPIVSSSGVTGHHAFARAEPPGIVIGRYGSLGSVHWVTTPYWPLNTSLWVKDFKGNDPRYLSYLMQTIRTDGSSASAVPGVNRNHLHRLPVRVPDVPAQRRIAQVLSSFDDLIETNQRRIEILEELVRSLYREWFERFRFPGHGRTDGSLPVGWAIQRASKIFAINPKVRPTQATFSKVTMGDLDERVSTVFRGSEGDLGDPPPGIAVNAAVLSPERS